MSGIPAEDFTFYGVHELVLGDFGVLVGGNLSHFQIRNYLIIILNMCLEVISMLLLIVSDQMRIRRKVLKADLALKDFNRLTLRLLQNAVIRV